MLRQSHDSLSKEHSHQEE
jgi:hypothetical protein